MAADIIPGERDLLLVVDVQNDFCPEGALGVPEGDAVVPVINRIQPGFAHVVLTQDWHPAGHQSFSSTHPGHQPFETVEAAYGPQTLWPDHCVQGTPGAAFHPDLDTDKAELIVRKGTRAEIDSYSAFYETTARPRPGSPATCASAASRGSSSAAWRPTIASISRRSTRLGRASRPCSSRTPAAASTSTARWPRPKGPWRAPGSPSSPRPRSAPDTKARWNYDTGPEA